MKRKFLQWKYLFVFIVTAIFCILAMLYVWHLNDIEQKKQLIRQYNGEINWNSGRGTTEFVGYENGRGWEIGFPPSWVANIKHLTGNEEHLFSVITKGLKPTAYLSFHTIDNLSRKDLSNFYRIPGLKTLSLYQIKDVSAEYDPHASYYDSTVSALHVACDQFTDSDLVEIAKNKKIMNLWISGGNYSQMSSEKLSFLSRLKFLRFHDMTFDNFKFGSQKMEQVIQFELHNCKFNPNVLEFLEQIHEQMPNLSSLGISNINLTPSDLIQVGKIEKIFTLSLANCNLTSVDSLFFEGVNLGRVFITGDETQQVQCDKLFLAKGLREVQLHYCKLTQETCFADQLNGLEKLAIRNSDLSPEFFEVFSRMPNLKWLEIRDCQLKQQNLEKIGLLNNLESLDFFSCGLESVDILPFEKWGNLKYLNLRNNPIQNLDELKKRLPKLILDT